MDTQKWIWIKCDGKVLECREVGPVIFRLKANSIPIKLTTRLVDDVEARRILRELLDLGLYEGGKVRDGDV